MNNPLPPAPPPPLAPGYGSAPPPGWAFVAPHLATRLGTTPASFGQRLAAYLIDGLILLVLSIPLWVVGGLLLTANWNTELGTCTDRDGDVYLCDVPTDSTVGWMVVVMGLGIAAMLTIAVFYWGRFEGVRGQTPGKKALGLRTMDRATGQPIGFGRGVGRMFARILSQQLLVLGYLWMLWDENKQTWHDKIVRSIVVKE